MEQNAENASADQAARLKGVAADLHLRREVVKKLPFLETPEGKIRVLAQLDDYGAEPYAISRPLKDPGYTWIEMLWHHDKTRDGKPITHSGVDMMRRAHKLGRYHAQSLAHWLQNRSKRKPVQKDRLGLDISITREDIDRMAAERQAHRGRKMDDSGEFVGRMTPESREVGPARPQVRVRFGMPPFENVIEMEKTRLLRGPERGGAPVAAPRLLAGAEAGRQEAAGGDGKVAGATAVGMFRPAGLLPPPRPAKTRKEVDRDGALKATRLTRAGRSAARKAALKKGREKSRQVLGKHRAEKGENDQR